MASGAISLPVLLHVLSEKLVAEENLTRQPIIWLKGQQSENQSTGIWSHPPLLGFLDRYFTVLPGGDIDVGQFQETYSERGPYHLLILEGYFTSDPDDWLHNLLKDLIVVARGVILLGNEACWGKNVPEGFMDLETDLLYHVETPYFRLPGAPLPARHLLGLLNHLILYDLPEIDEYRRPKMFYSQRICDRCLYRGDFEAGRFVRYFGEREGCLYLLGCKGPVTWNSCPVERWNGVSSWCVAAGSPCTGCSEPDYPHHQGLGMYGRVSGGSAGVNSIFIRHTDDFVKGAFGVTVAGIALHALSKKRSALLGEQRLPRMEIDEDE